jgi:hypothetical protein
MTPPSRDDRPPAGKAARDGGPVEAASYIAEVAGELAQLATRHRLDMLRYVLDMAVLEAGDFVRLRNEQNPKA